MTGSSGSERGRRLRAETAEDFLSSLEKLGLICHSVVAPGRRNLFLLSFSKHECFQGVTQRGQPAPPGTSVPTESFLRVRDTSASPCVHVFTRRVLKPCVSLPLCQAPGRQWGLKDPSAPLQAVPFPGALVSAPHLPSCVPAHVSFPPWAPGFSSSPQA